MEPDLSKFKARGRGRGRGLDVPVRQDLPSTSGEQLRAGGRSQFLNPHPGRSQTLSSAQLSSEDSTSSVGRGLPMTQHITSRDDVPARPRGALVWPNKEILRTRPSTVVSKVGTSGERVRLYSNYFKLVKNKDWMIHQYRVDFEPECVFDRLRKALIWQKKDLFGGHVFDGQQLFTIKKLPDDITRYAVTARDETVYNVTVKFTNLVSQSENQSIQIMNLILRKAMDSLKLQLVGRNFFDPDAKVQIPEYHIELWPGYTTSIRQHENDILLCSEIAHKVMRLESIYDIMKKIRQNERDFTKALQEKLLGSTVLTSYNNKTYRIDDFKFDLNPLTEFETKNGKISFMAYYKSRYNITIRDANQPLILSKAKKKDIRGGQEQEVLLVPELCRATGITDEMRNNFRLMKAMAEHTRMGPAARIERLYAFNRRLTAAQKENPVFSEWGLKLEPQLVHVNARTLPPERIYLGNNKIYNTDFKGDWTNEFHKNTLYKCVALDRWFIIYTQRQQREVDDFSKMLQSIGNNLGFNTKPPKMVMIQDDRPLTYVQELKKCVNQNPQLIMCVVSNNNADRYSNIKKTCCIDYPVPTQVITHKTITPRQGNTRGLMSIATKVSIQMSCKLGGIPWLIDIPMKGLMTMGFDVCHDPKDKSKSYGALVSTMDLKESTKFFSSVSAHKNGEELSNQLLLDFTKALTQYREIHGALPSRICMYRDGVGDGQIQQVYEHEVKNLKRRLDEIYGAAGTPKFIYIIVSKRINTRFFTENANPKAGTVVDNEVTLPERYDFYLVPQSIREGTATPTSYNVIYDTFGLGPDKVQHLTYKFCYLYYNWSGTVRVPCVCQYAHKLAFLVSQSLRNQPSTGLERQLYFL